MDEAEIREDRKNRNDSKNEADTRVEQCLRENADTSELLTDEEEAKSVALAAENAKKAAGKAENTETDDELMKELLERAEKDSEEDE